MYLKIALSLQTKGNTLFHQFSNDLSECLACVLGKNGTASITSVSFFVLTAKYEFENKFSISI